MKKIAVYNIKGGVGKTTTTVNLACLLSRMGYSVLLWDLDPQGGSSYFFNLENNNDNTHAKLFDRYISIYDVIQTTDTYQIDVISNDSKFSDQFMNKAARITALNFMNNDLIGETLNQVADDYDFCLFDCSPGKFQLHENIFSTSDLLLIPNIPAPLSIYCNNILLKELEAKIASGKKMFSFFNMVQAHKNLHKFYLQQRNDNNANVLANYIPFYSEIENINLKKESIFHQLKAFKTNVYYEKLWLEICERMQWPLPNSNNAVVRSITEEPASSISPIVNLEKPGRFQLASSI